MSDLPFVPIEPPDDNDKESKDDLLNDAFTTDPTPDSPDEKLTEKLLQERLQEYQQALEQEWETEKAYVDGELTPTEIRAKTKELLTQAVPKAVASLLYLSQHAVNESVKMKAATFIIDKAIGHEKGLVGDPMEELLSEMNRAKAS